MWHDNLSVLNDVLEYAIESSKLTSPFQNSDVNGIGQQTMSPPQSPKTDNENNDNNDEEKGEEKTTKSSKKKGKKANKQKESKENKKEESTNLKYAENELGTNQSFQNVLQSNPYTMFHNADTKLEMADFSLKLISHTLKSVIGKKREKENWKKKQTWMNWKKKHEWIETKNKPFFLR